MIVNKRGNKYRLLDDRVSPAQDLTGGYVSKEELLRVLFYVRMNKFKVEFVGDFFTFPHGFYNSKGKIHVCDDINERVSAFVKIIDGVDQKFSEVMDTLGIDVSISEKETNQ